MQKRVIEINAFSEILKSLKDNEFPVYFQKLRERFKEGSTLSELLPETFALVREVSERVLQMRHFDVQLIGGMVLVEGKIAEMKTGEGKTLVATLSLVLQALTATGGHLVTVNDYLARRDAVWMGQIYHALGLSVGCIQSDQQSFVYDPELDVEHSIYPNLRPITRKEAYQADITYGTNNEFGFDFLRDNMAQRMEDKVQRPLAFAIVDEVDSILIDEARTPLIISGPAQEATSEYRRYAELVERLQVQVDYDVDEKQHAVTLTQVGIKKMETALGVSNIYDLEGITMAHHIEQALKAKALYLRDRDYLVKDGRIVIVDEFTGRMLEGRRYSEGLHQAIEAKEGVEIKQENVTLATITFQNYFRLYKTLSGMTGTAATEAEEFGKIYGLDVVVVPTHRPMIRKDNADLIYKTEAAKFQAVMEQIRDLHIKGQPVLVGTISVEKSERLSNMLQNANVPHSVLNAKYHEKEAEIVAQAGTRGAVTIATNMAGRGTDIVLGGFPRDSEKEKEIVGLGGLCVIGTERHESRRIDHQLRGRSGRQGDPGETQFYVSLEDDLMRIFGSDRVKTMMNALRLPEDVPIQHSMITKALESAQKRVEGHHFDARKHLVEYDDIMNTHRDVIYKRRDAILRASQFNDGSTKEMLLTEIHNELGRIVAIHTMESDIAKWELTQIQERFIAMIAGDEHRVDLPLIVKNLKNSEPAHVRDALLKHLEEMALSGYAGVEERVGNPELMREIERALLLRSIDTFWIEHLEQMKQLRETIGLRGYGQRDPLVEYKKEAYIIFTQLLENIGRSVASMVFKVRVEEKQAPVKPTLIEQQQQHQTNRSDSERSSEQLHTTKVGRNDPCPCGSGRKYKKCHGT